MKLIKSCFQAISHSLIKKLDKGKDFFHLVGTGLSVAIKRRFYNLFTDIIFVICHNKMVKMSMDVTFEKLGIEQNK